MCGCEGEVEHYMRHIRCFTGTCVGDRSTRYSIIRVDSPDMASCRLTLTLMTLRGSIYKQVLDRASFTANKRQQPSMSTWDMYFRQLRNAFATGSVDCSEPSGRDRESLDVTVASHGLYVDDPAQRNMDESLTFRFAVGKCADADADGARMRLIVDLMQVVCLPPTVVTPMFAAPAFPCRCAGEHGPAGGSAQHAQHAPPGDLAPPAPPPASPPKRPRHLKPSTKWGDTRPRASDTDSD